MPHKLDALRIALIGTRFMGKAHSNAWLCANRFFDLPLTVQMHTICGRDESDTHAFAKRWGWDHASTSFDEVMSDSAINLVDIGTPNHVHREQAMAALAAGKHVACEKPLAGTLADARAMRDAALRVRKKGLRTFVWFNYRRCPAVAMAHQIVKSGRLGTIYHIRAQYLQDWAGPKTPMSWRFKASEAGSGAHGDLNAHIIDMARFITGDEVREVNGAIQETFIKSRPLPPDARRKSKNTATGKSDVDDCSLFLARFRKGTVASFEASRLATGNKNRNTIEINGEHGSLKFDFERMNELQWWDDTIESRLRGWSTILCTTPNDHPYIDAYWPPGHLIGYEHQFISQAADIVLSLAGKTPLIPIPDFDDAFQTQRVLEAATVAAREKRTVLISEIK
ncbi:MAG: Gfo/Idh/MocA family protein [Phycisphaerales bacterium]